MSDENLGDRLQSTCALADTARELKRAQLRLEHPGIERDEVEAMLARWLQTRPGAEDGDGAGRPARWPRG